MDVALAADSGRARVRASSTRMWVSLGSHDRVHGVEAQAVEAVLLQPVERVVDEEVAHRGCSRKSIAAPHGVLKSSVKKLGRVAG